MLKFKDIFDLEKKSVFIINFLLVLFIIIIFLYDLPMRIFFYAVLVSTIIFSYLFFKKSKKLAKTLIVTNLFIFFYFLYPYVASYFYEVAGNQTYSIVLLYTILISYAFLVFAGKQKTFLGDLSKFDFKFMGIILILGIFLGFLFSLTKEPIPALFIEILQNNGLLATIGFLIFTSLIIAVSEQMIFSGVLFNSYKELTSRYDAYFQTAILFVMFHLLRFEVLVSHYYLNFPDLYLFYITGYYILLFAFMLLALYLYSHNGRKHKGNFFYPVGLHFGADFGLFVFYFALAI